LAVVTALPAALVANAFAPAIVFAVVVSVSPPIRSSTASSVYFFKLSSKVFNEPDVPVIPARVCSTPVIFSLKAFSAVIALSVSTLIAASRALTSCSIAASIFAYTPGSLISIHLVPLK
jgi:hypothetical protein